jgi:hypothetical protein
MSTSASATGAQRTSKVMPMASTVDGSEVDELVAGAVGRLVSVCVHDPVAMTTMTATRQRDLKLRRPTRV